MPVTDRAVRRAPLSRERILETAVELCDTSGLGALTMRRLGEVLGVEAMSLYHYVEGKEDLLTGIVDVVLSKINLTPPANEWKLATRESAVSALEVLLEHPWSCGLVLSPDSTQIVPARMRWIESILARFRSAGFSPTGASRGYHAIDSHVLGFTLWELGHSPPSDAPPDYLEQILDTFDFTGYPYLAEHAHEHLRDVDGPAVGEFEFGLDLILDGLARMRTTA